MEQCGLPDGEELYDCPPFCAALRAEAEAKLKEELDGNLKLRAYIADAVTEIKDLQAKLAAATRTNMEYSKRVDADKKRIAELEAANHRAAVVMKEQQVEIARLQKCVCDGMDAHEKDVKRLEAEIKARDRTIYLLRPRA